ncbi:hypothetical protein [Sphingobacterium siyangense]|uniref:Exonuclease SbcC n=1 Tax=Sphingobacterium siyangense TaxID=459529 RepID=A0A562M7G2_9SPHI|nr:hypothetical protein [Sphingobacterium siyangense]TWI15511.1 exonuclease SbcC [Sphingobacterium siyangense]
MKFKKVEIQAFRAYDKVENGTFDFTTNDTGEIADFISIYAPNGFGKTSFYDAVEWGFTNNINRFLRKHGKNADAAKAERTYKANFGNKDKQHIIRNKYSNPDLQGFVRLTTTISNDVIVNNIPDVRSGQPDFKFKATDTKKGTEFFQDVLLSQEWIDAFLKEDDAGIRYDKFITYFGDKKLDGYYKNVVNLIKTNDTNIVDLKGKLEDCQLQLNLDVDIEILSKINSHIDFLKQHGLDFQNIGSEFSDMDFLALSDLISTKLLNLEFELEKLLLNERSLEDLLVGTFEESGATIYIESIGKLKQSAEELQKFQATYLELKTEQQRQSDLIQVNKKLDLLAETLKEAENVKNNFTTYSEILGQYNTITLNLNSENEKLIAAENNRENSDLKLKQLDNRINTILAEIEKMRQVFVDVTQEESVRLKLTTLQSETNKEFQEIEETNNGKKTERSLLLEGLIEQELTQEYIKDNKFNLLPDFLKIKFQSEIQLAESLIVERGEVSKDLEKLNSTIEQQKQFSEELQQFILRGSELVNKSQSSRCPLCDTAFESFDQLSSEINNNNSLNNVMQLLIERRLNSTKELDKISGSIVNALQPLVAEVERQVDATKSQIKLQDELIEGLENKLNELKDKSKDNEAKLLAWSAKLSGLTPEKFNSNNQAAIDLLINELANLHHLQKDFIKSGIDGDSEINDLKNNVAEKRKLLKQARENPSYEIVLSFYKRLFPEVDVEVQHLDDFISKISKEINDLSGVKSIIIKASDEFKKLGIINGIDEVIADLTISEHINDSHLRLIKRFEQSAEGYGLKIDRDISLADLEKTIKDEILKVNMLATKNIETTQHLRLLEKLKENVMPFLTHQRIRHAADDLTKRIKLLKDKVGKSLTAERDRISKFIHEQVESFFFEDLINVLYRKIDPHPECKKIKFQCDFSNDKPKLNVFVTGENGDNPLVPNLYFSTAQMNILSLSIFLAKALNAENKGQPVNCIFIDDPIQSMDSINILSAIDLFRSIVVKFKKQIILSTHDENFHNLLRKKIPVGLFNAKYIELETFGTVKANT